MSGFILDKPDQIEAFGLLQVLHKLKMEVDHPGGPTWRVSPAVQARAILERAGRPNPGRTKEKTLASFEAYLREKGTIT